MNAEGCIRVSAERKGGIAISSSLVCPVGSWVTDNRLKTSDGNFFLTSDGKYVIVRTV